MWPGLILVSTGGVACVLWRAGELSEVLLLALGFAAGSAYLRGVAEATTGRDPMCM